ncbi:MAG: 4-alpha-glucanotransferase, partial [Oscillospiraceae bacterium]
AFHEQWQKLRAYAHENGVKIIGDVPIYVPLDSADVWARPENFQLGRTRRPECVAGCPPDGFSKNGQYWGNAIYDWERMEQSGFSWWLQRIGAAGRNYDVVRIDHFRGIESYWSIPAVNKTARKEHRVKGPGMKLVGAIQKAYPDIAFIAEDLGFLTPEVLQLVEDSGWPGMKVLEFAFDPREPSNYLPHKYGENCICYTGTHDNETLRQWCAGISPESRTLRRKTILEFPRRTIWRRPLSRRAPARRRSSLSRRCRTISASAGKPHERARHAQAGKLALADAAGAGERRTGTGSCRLTRDTKRV